MLISRSLTKQRLKTTMSNSGLENKSKHEDSHYTIGYGLGNDKSMQVNMNIADLLPLQS
jgi:hypothetical protein